jgi:transcriptional regulator with XRE-family HTH domain
MSQEDLSRLTGIPEATISRLENDRTTPRPSTLRKLATSLNVNPAWLRFGEGEPEGESAARSSLAAA